MEQRKASFAVATRWVLGITIAATIVILPYFYYRWTYTKTKRLRVVTPGKFYRSGRMSGAGLEFALKRYKIRTVINLMDEEQDPQLRRHYFSSDVVSEQAICNKYGANYKFLPVETLPGKILAKHRPKTIDRFLEILDNPANYPILLHCRAGLHRTGILTAVYRMEYHQWTPAQAWLELRENGFGEANCYANNEYIYQYVFTYKPGLRRSTRAAQNDTAGWGTPLDELIRRTNLQPETGKPQGVNRE